MSATVSRVDDRTPNQLRHILCETGMISSANGSAYIEIGKTKVICAVHGPRSTTSQRSGTFSDMGQLECDFRYAPFTTPITNDPNVNIIGASSTEKQYSQLILDALESTVCLSKYPKSFISIHIMILQTCGGELAAAVTCASLALADAAVEQFELVSACQVILNPLSNTILLDPTTHEITSSTGSVTACYTPSGSITLLHVTGRLDPVVLLEMQRAAGKGCAFIKGVIEVYLRQRILQRLNNSSSNNNSYSINNAQHMVMSQEE
eukprot:gene3524-7011_t